MLRRAKLLRKSEKADLMVEQACRTCRFLTTTNICPNCKRSGLSSEWAGELIVIEPEKSILAKRIGAIKQGRYALRVR